MNKNELLKTLCNKLESMTKEELFASYKNQGIDANFSPDGVGRIILYNECNKVIIYEDETDKIVIKYPFNKYKNIKQWRCSDMINRKDLIRLDGFVELLNNQISVEEFTAKFVEWVKSNGWEFYGVAKRGIGDVNPELKMFEVLSGDYYYYIVGKTLEEVKKMV